MTAGKKGKGAGTGRAKAKVRGATSEVEVDVEDFFSGQAEEDRGNAKASHVDDGLKAAKEMVARMAKGIAYASCVHDFDTKLAVLSEVADTAAAVTDDARRAVRNAHAETKNLQPTS